MIIIENIIFLAFVFIFKNSIIWKKLPLIIFMAKIRIWFFDILFLYKIQDIRLIVVLVELILFILLLWLEFVIVVWVLLLLLLGSIIFFIFLQIRVRLFKIDFICHNTSHNGSKNILELTNLRVLRLMLLILIVAFPFLVW